MVRFDQDTKKIRHIRLHWDQASLLKDMDVIGARGKHWPIRSGKEQVRLVASLASPSSANPDEAALPSDASKLVGGNRPAAASNGVHARIVKDPYASLSLFSPASAAQPPSTPQQQRPAMTPLRASAKPPPRDYGELFGDGGGDGDNDSTPRPSSSSGTSFTGASKHYKPSRLFGVDSAEDNSNNNNDGAMAAATPRMIKPDAKKYQHFEFSDGSDANAAAEERLVKPDAKKFQHFEFGDVGGDNNNTAAHDSKPSTSSSRPRAAAKHSSQWDFEDFVTPEKPRRRVREQDVRHFRWGEEEEDGDGGDGGDGAIAGNSNAVGRMEQQATSSLTSRPRKMGQPRRDAEAHFEFQDDGPPAERPRMRPMGSTHNTGLGLYENNVYSEEGDGEDDSTAANAHKRKNGTAATTQQQDEQQDEQQQQLPLSNVTNVGKNGNNNNSKSNHATTSSISMHRKTFGSQFALTDESPAASPATAAASAASAAASVAQASKRKENMGFGGYGYGYNNDDDDDDDDNKNNNDSNNRATAAAADAPKKKAGVSATTAAASRAQAAKSFWDFE